MITTISRKIADFLVREKTIEEETVDIYVYGIELWVSSAISIVIMLITTIVLGKVVEGLIFYIVFCVTRLFCGGYHANSYMGCKMVFWMILLTVLFLQKALQGTPFGFWIVLWCFYTFIIFCFAPIENENKKLEVDEKKKYKIVSIILSFFWLLIEWIVNVLQHKLAGLIPVTLALIAVLMLLEISKNYLKKGEYKNEKRCKRGCT